jgi:hypothetical protein
MNLEIPTELPPMPEAPDLKKYLLIVIVAFAINALIVAALVLAFGAMAAAKCLFIEIAVGTGLLFIGIFFFHVDISNLLKALEILAEDGRDETVVQMRHGRAQLRQINQRLEYTIHPPEHENAMHDLVQILISKEKNWMQLGLFGWRLAKDAMRVMKQTRNI